MKPPFAYFGGKTKLADNEALEFGVVDGFAVDGASVDPAVGDAGGGVVLADVLPGDGLAADGACSSLSHEVTVETGSDIEQRRGPHHPPGRCQWCGGVLRPSLTCVQCGAPQMVDCRPVQWKRPCSAPGCVFTGEVGADLHDVVVDGEETYFCARHCPAPDCNPEGERNDG